MKFISIIILLASITQAIRFEGKLDPEISLAEKEYFAHEGDEDQIKEDEWICEYKNCKTKLNLISTNLFSTNPNPKYIKDFTFKDIIENIEIIFSKNKKSKIYLETNSNLNI